MSDEDSDAVSEDDENYKYFACGTCPFGGHVSEDELGERCCPNCGARERPELDLRPGWKLMEVRGNHTKPCSACGKDDWEVGEYYVSYPSDPWGMDKYCVDCAEAHVGYDSSEDEFPDEESDERSEEDEEPEERSREERPEESRGTVPNSSNVTSESAKRHREDEPEDGGDAAAKQTRRVA